MIWYSMVWYSLDLTEVISTLSYSTFTLPYLS